jgi:hypothetical protein
VYYAESFESSCSVVNVLERNNTFSIAIVQEIFNESNEFEGAEN